MLVDSISHAGQLCRGASTGKAVELARSSLRHFRYRDPRGFAKLNVAGLATYFQKLSSIDDLVHQEYCQRKI